MSKKVGYKLTFYTSLRTFKAPFTLRAALRMSARSVKGP